MRKILNVSNLCLILTFFWKAVLLKAVPRRYDSFMHNAQSNQMHKFSKTLEVKSLYSRSGSQILKNPLADKNTFVQSVFPRIFIQADQFFGYTSETLIIFNNLVSKSSGHQFCRTLKCETTMSCEYATQISMIQFSSVPERTCLINWPKLTSTALLLPIVRIKTSVDWICFQIKLVFVVPSLVQVQHVAYLPQLKKNVERCRLNSKSMVGAIG